MSEQRLIYLPLGGAGEIGMNAYVYGYGKAGQERLILVDLGVTFPDMDSTPGVDLILPDITWLQENRNRLEAIIITHAHEDHVGAVGHYWAELGAPILARPFTGYIARQKLADHNQPERAVEIIDETFPHLVEKGPFKIGFLPISHSIPESSAIVIDTPAGRIIHSGDFKRDPTPLVGEAMDLAQWQKACSGGVHAFMCDSTNVFSPHQGRSEAELPEPIKELMEEAKGLVAATTFASNIARVKTLADAGVAAGRSVCLLGRAMRRMIEAALATGVLREFPKTISPEDAKLIPRENLLLLTTGSQGERRAASAQLAQGSYLGLSLKEGDTFLFSSKIIPGNERDVHRIMNQFSMMGVTVVDDAGGRYHVSGHANRPDLVAMHDLVSPKMMIPMHGEHRHLREHARLAQEKRIASAVCANGTMLDLTGANPEVAEHIEAGRFYVDGTQKIGALDGVVRNRIRMARNGLVVVTALLDEEDVLIGEPWCTLSGLAELGNSNAPLVDCLEEDLGQFIGRAGRVARGDDDKLEEGMRRVVRQTCQAEIGKKPEVQIIISRLQ